MQTATFSYNEYLFEVKHSNDRQLIVKKYKLDFSIKKLNFVEEIHWTCNSTATVSLLGGGSVIEFVTGSHIPVLLVSVSKKYKLSEDVQYYLFRIDSEKLTAVRKFMTNSNISTSITEAGYCTSFKITDGPAVLVYGRNKISYFFSQKSCELQFATSEIKSIDVSQCNLCLCCSNISVKRCMNADILTVYSVLPSLFTFSKLKLATLCPSHSSQEILETIHVCHIRNGTICELKVDHFVPVEYLTVVKCMCIKYINNDGNNISSSLFIGTSNGFVLHIIDGRVLQCVPLCSSDIGFIDTNMVIKMHLTGMNKTKSKLFICHDRAMKWTVFDENYQLGCVYTDIVEVYFGDFMQDGSIQFLLLKDIDLVKGQWILTDLYSMDISNIEDKESHHKDESTENTGSVLQALNSRLQNDQIEIERQTKLYQQRTSFMEELCARYTGDTPQIRNKTTNQTDLVPLVTGSGVHNNTGHLGSGEGQALLEVQEVWQRTLKDKWCVGADLINKCNSDVWVSLEMIRSSSTSMKSSTIVKSKLLSCPANKSHSQLDMNSESEIKKRKQSLLDPLSFQSLRKPENKCLTVVCVTDLPDFSISDTCLAHLLLHVTTYNHDSSTEELGKGDNSKECNLKNKSGSTSTKEELLISGGKVTISCTDVITGIHEIQFGTETEPNDNFDRMKDIYKDKLALQNIQTKTHLTVKSTPGHLANFASLLTSRAGFTYSSSLDCFYTSQTGLQNVQLALEPVKGHNDRNIIAYTRYEREIFVLLHHLHTCLPDHVPILPRNPYSSVLKEHFLSSINKEVHLLSHGINKLLQVNETKIEAEESKIDTNNEENLRKVGEKFKRSREKLIQKQSETLNRDSTSELQHQMEMFQSRTDIALAMIDS